MKFSNAKFRHLDITATDDNIFISHKDNKLPN